MKSWMKRNIAFILAFVMAFSPTFTGTVFAEQKNAAVHITSETDFPSEIKAGEIYVLDKDITLNENQQITTLAGTLDGHGHKITLVNQPLADTVSGTIQNLGVDSTGTLETNSYTGSMAVTLTGSIKNCYSLATLYGSGFSGYVGGLAGKVEGTATVSNSYYAGSMSDGCWGFNSGGIVGWRNSTESSLKSCYGTVSSGCQYGSSLSNFNQGYTTKTKDELKTCANLLNTDIENTGYYWTAPTDGSNNGLPILTEGEAPVGDVDWTVLENLVKDASEENEDDYTASSWNTFATALNKAKALIDSKEATQTTIDDMVTELSAAKSGLEKKRPTEPVKQPEETSGIIHITSQADLKAIDYSNKDAFYVLDNDITLKSNYMPWGDFNAVLDGQGHTITFENSMTGTFSNVGSQGVLQNIYFTGSIDAFQATGPVGGTVNGAVLNCYSDVTGNEYVYGFVGALNNGVISNCYSVSTATGGALMKSISGGVLYHTYWQDNLTQNVTFNESNLQNSSFKTEVEMKTKDFVTLLNQNKGDNGTAWGQSSKGYPYFGEDQEYTPDEPEKLPENQYDVFFTPYNSEEALEITDQQLDLSPDEVNQNGRIAGILSIPDLAEGSSLSWSKKEGSSDQISVYDSGELCLYGEGTAIIIAVEKTKEGENKEVASFIVNSTAKQMEDMKLYVGDTEIKGTYEVQGSQWTKITAKVKYEGTEDYVTVSSIRFTYKTDKTDYIYCTENSSEFYFKQPGTASITVTSKKNTDMKATATFTSVYVPVESIKPAIGGTHIIHGRNANSTQSKDFNPDYSGVVVTPENASYRNNYTITSSNPEVGKYVPDMVIGYVPYKAGTTTYTASIEDKDMNGIVQTVSGSSAVTYEYLNPLSKISAEQNQITVKNNTETKLDLTLAGTRSEEGYSLTEPELVWTYDKEGIVKIGRKGNGAFKRDESAPDNNQFFPSDEYYIYAQGEGTVTATGTPVDTTNQVEPIVIEITVTAGDTQAPDVDAMAAQGIKEASAYVNSQYSNQEYKYGNEWLVFASIHAGVEIQKDKLNSYYEDIVKEIKTWKSTQKPTDVERVALTLTILGKDITNVEGINLAEMIYNHPKLDVGSNELCYALLALDANKTEVPSNAKWTREKIVDALLKFQNEKDGGFGLYSNQDSGIDTTAMALQALAPYEKENAFVKETIEKAVDYLKKNLSADYDAGSAEATAQVLLAVTALQKDPLSATVGLGTPYKNLITCLNDYKSGSAGFAHTKGGAANEMATIQAMMALDAFRHYRSNQKPYWDLTGIQTEGPIIPTEPSKPIDKPEEPATPTEPETPANPVKAPEKVNGLKAATAGTTSIKLTWKKVTGAKGYIVYRYNLEKKTYDEIKRTTALSMTDTKLIPGTQYAYRIRAYTTSGSKILMSKASATAKGVTRPTTPQIISLKKWSNTKADINIKTTKKVKGYRLYEYNSKTKKYALIGKIEGRRYYKYHAKTKKFTIDNKSKVAVKTNGSSITVTLRTVNVNFNKYARYRYKVRSYVTYNGKTTFSGYSKVKTLIR
ncbi:MAG: cell surface protein [Lachnospiraceae bacterium]|nr:cell surface protein [Lachnospiraceae bacterium]